MFTVNLSWTPDIRMVATALNRYAGALRSWRVPFERSIEQVTGPSFQRNFDVGGRPPWEPLSETAVFIRGSAAPILVRSGLLREVAGQLNIWTIEGPRGEAYVDVTDLPRAEYGIFHQEGTTWMTERPWAVFQPEDVDKIAEIFGDFLAERGIAQGFAVTRGQ